MSLTVGVVSEMRSVGRKGLREILQMGSTVAARPGDRMQPTPHTRHWSWRQPGPSPHPGVFHRTAFIPTVPQPPPQWCCKDDRVLPISVRIQDQNILRADSFPSDHLTCVKLQPLVGSHPLSSVLSHRWRECGLVAHCPTDLCKTTASSAAQ